MTAITLAAPLSLLLPVRKRCLVEIAIQFRDTRLHARLCVYDGLVVQQGAKVLNKEVKQQTCTEISQRFWHVPVEVGLYRLNCFLPLLLRKLKHHSSPLVLGRRSRIRSSREQAPRMARAKALKMASILWWLERPYMVFTCTFAFAPRAKPSKKSGTSSV